MIKPVLVAILGVAQLALFSAPVSAQSAEIREFLKFGRDSGYTCASYALTDMTQSGPLPSGWTTFIAVNEGPQRAYLRVKGGERFPPLEVYEGKDWQAVIYDLDARYTYELKLYEPGATKLYMCRPQD